MINDVVEDKGESFLYPHQASLSRHVTEASLVGGGGGLSSASRCSPDTEA